MTRIAVDGIDCAGKTALADRLAELLGAARLSKVSSSAEPLVGDGIFLQRPELDDLRDLRIWLDVPFEVALERAVARAAPRMDDPRGRADIVVPA